MNAVYRVGAPLARRRVAEHARYSLRWTHRTWTSSTRTKRLHKCCVNELPRISSCCAAANPYTQSRATRGFATAADSQVTDTFGPLQEYDRRVDSGLLRNDEHQRGRFCYPECQVNCYANRPQGSYKASNTSTMSCETTRRRPSFTQVTSSFSRRRSPCSHPFSVAVAVRRARSATSRQTSHADCIYTVTLGAAKPC